MNIQYYISNDFCKSYLPFALYRGCLTKVIKEVYNISIEYIYNFESLYNNTNSIIIMNIYSINAELLNILSTFESKKILINTEYYENLNISQYFDFIKDKPNFYLFEYNILNINYLKNTNININYQFIPLCYSSFLEDYYNSKIVKKTFSEKDIDILFLGKLKGCKRRKNIINPLSTKYNIVTKYNFDDKANIELCNLIERSKIVLNVLFYNNNVIFDYYRNSFILSTRTLLITEKSFSTDYNIEDGLLELENNIINVEYDEIIETVKKYINISEEEYNKLVDRQYNAFKKYTMDNKITNFFNKIL
jgi:hypothetical protein